MTTDTERIKSLIQESLDDSWGTPNDDIHDWSELDLSSRQKSIIEQQLAVLSKGYTGLFFPGDPLDPSSMATA